MRLRSLLTTALLLAAPLAFAHSPSGTPKRWCETTPAEFEVHEYGPSAPGVGFFLGDGSVGDCDQDGIPGNGDGHAEAGLGYAILYAGAWSSEHCSGVVADHVPYPHVEVVDDSGAPVRFVVGVDHSSEYDFCGDFELETYQECLGSCDVALHPGMDGAYHVLVDGTSGHLFATPRV